MTLVTLASACASRDAKGPGTPTASGATARPRTPSDPPPAAPPIVATNEVAGVAPTNAEVAPAPGPATLGKDEDELAKIGPNQAEMEEQARVNAQAAAKDKAKWAKQAHDADRRGTEDWSRDHVQKAAARAVEIQNQSSRVPAAKRGRFNTDMTTFQTRRSEVLSRISGLRSSGIEEWKMTKAALDHAIEEMDQALMRLEGDL